MRRFPSPNPPLPPRRAGLPGPREAGIWLHGLHPVAAALANPARRLKRLLVTEEAEAALVARLPLPWRITPERVERGRFPPSPPEDWAHRGAPLLAEPLPNLPLDRALAHNDGPVLVLDQVT